MRKFCKSTYHLLYVLMISLLIISGCSTQNQQNKPTPEYGTPTRFVEDLDINTINIDQIANDDAYLYLLDAYESVLRAFDLDGNYLFTLEFYDYANGAFNLAVKNRCLYVRDPYGHVYVFEEGEFTRFIERNNAINLLESIDFEKNATNYVIRLASVWKVCETGNVCVIERPLYSILYQQKTHSLIIVGLVLVLTFIRLFLHLKKRN